MLLTSVFGKDLLLFHVCFLLNLILLALLILILDKAFLCDFFFLFIIYYCWLLFVILSKSFLKLVSVPGRTAG